MNTLPAGATSLFFQTDDGWVRLREQWRTLMSDKEKARSLTATHHLLYGAASGRNWMKGFTPLSPMTRHGQVCIENGAAPYGAALRALEEIRSAANTDASCQKLLDPFQGILSAESLRRIGCCLPLHMKGEAYSNKGVVGMVHFALETADAA